MNLSIKIHLGRLLEGIFIVLNKFILRTLLVYGVYLSILYGSNDYEIRDKFEVIDEVKYDFDTDFFILNQNKSNKLDTIAKQERDRKKPWLNILCKYADTVDELMSRDELHKMFGDTYPFLGHYWKETTYGHIDIAGTKTVDSWLTLPHNKSYYITESVNDDGSISSYANTNLLATDCKNIAGSIYDKNLYYSTNLFFSSGVGGLGAKDSNTWLSPMKLLGLIAHEMGHVYGLGHSSGRFGYDYDSPWDVMSSAHLGASYNSYEHIPQHTIAFHKQKLGAIPFLYNFNNTKFDTSLGYTFHLSRLEEQGKEGSYLIANIKSTDKSKYYTIETREPIGYDSSLPGKAVIIHEIENNNRAYVVGSNEKNSQFDILSDSGTMWTVNETFTDTVNNISIEIVSETSTGFNVKVIAPRIKLDEDIKDTDDSSSDDSNSNTDDEDIKDTDDSSSDDSNSNTDDEDIKDTDDSSSDDSNSNTDDEDIKDTDDSSSNDSNPNTDEDISSSKKKKISSTDYLLPLFVLFIFFYRNREKKASLA